MGVYPSICKICNKDFMWFSGISVQICGVCIQTTESDIDKFMEDNRDLMDDLAKQEEVDKLRNRLKELKSAHELIGILIKELENEIKS